MKTNRELLLENGYTFDDYENAITDFLIIKKLDKSEVFWQHGFTCLELAEHIEKYINEVQR